MLDDQPLTIRIDTDQPRHLAGLLVNSPDVVGVELEPKVLQREGTVGSLIVRAKHPQRFFKEVARLVIDEGVNVFRLEALDDSAPCHLGVFAGRERQDVMSTLKRPNHLRKPFPLLAFSRHLQFPELAGSSKWSALPLACC